MTRRLLVAELEGDDLDLAVGLALGWRIVFAGEFNSGRWERQDGSAGMLVCVFHPSSFPAHGHGIIDRERIATWGTTNDGWCAHHPKDDPSGYPGDSHYIDVTATAHLGPTLLVAGMRAFVASRFGDLVDLPDEVDL